MKGLLFRSVFNKLSLTIPKRHFSTGVIKYSDILHTEATLGVVKARKLVHEACYLNNQKKIIAFVEENKDYMTDHIVAQIANSLVEYQIAIAAEPAYNAF